MRLENTHQNLGSSAIALALGIGILLAPLSAHALIISSESVAFSGSASVTDPEGGASTTKNGVTLATTALQQFNATTGVLMGATLSLNSTREQSVSVTSTAGGGTGANSNVTTTGSGSSTAKVTAVGVSNTFSTINGTDSCAGKRKDACSDGATLSSNTTLLTNAAVSAADLDSYVGGGSVSVLFTAPQISATQGSGQFTGSESTTNTLNWRGTVSLGYEYLLHAAPSLDGGGLSLDLDFGTRYVGDLAILDFSLSNAVGERVGLDLDVVTSSGDEGSFGTSLDLFTALLAGNSLSYTAWLDTSIAGAYAASYLLDLSDADVGAASSRRSFQMRLNLMGSVLEQPVVVTTSTNSVPEPTSLALLGLGVLGIAALRRRA